MLLEIIIHGVGGQGALTSGQLLATAALRKGLAVSVVPYYTPEVRGGEANAITVLSSEPIGSVLPAEWDVALLLASKAALRYAAETRPGGVIIYNSTLVSPPDAREGVEIIGIPASQAADSLGNLRGANLVMLGALCEYWDAISADALCEAVYAEFTGRKAKFVPANLRVIDAGVEALKAARPGRR